MQGTKYSKYQIHTKEENVKVELDKFRYYSSGTLLDMLMRKENQTKKLMTEKVLFLTMVVYLSTVYF